MQARVSVNALVASAMLTGSDCGPTDVTLLLYISVWDTSTVVYLRGCEADKGLHVRRGCCHFKTGTCLLILLNLIYFLCIQRFTLCILKLLSAAP